jgi:hypothetical protein
VSGTLHVKRRSVLTASAATGLAASVATFADPAEAAAIPARQRFTKLVGHTFTVTQGSHRTRWRLDAVQDSPYRPHGLTKHRLAVWREKEFVLSWSTASLPQQGTFTMHHPVTGHFRMFAVPGLRRRHRTSVTAVFNGWRG